MLDELQNTYQYIPVTDDYFDIICFDLQRNNLECVSPAAWKYRNKNFIVFVLSWIEGHPFSYVQSVLVFRK